MINNLVKFIIIIISLLSLLLSLLNKFVGYQTGKGTFKPNAL